MGFDFGLKRIGVAVGSPVTGQAQALSVLSARQGVPDWAQVSALVKDWQPRVFVAGDPNSDDRNLMGQLKKFVKELEGRFELPVHLIDESYSSIEAGYQLKQGGDHKGLIRKKLDKVAAALILESWFCENESERDGDEP